MPLYIVRWPNLSAAIVRATDEDDLLDQLDEEGNAEGCRIEEYEGPLFIDFELPVAYEVNHPDDGQGPISPEHIAVKDVSKLLEAPAGVELAAGACDTGYDMCEAVMRFAFPHVFQAWSTAAGEPNAEELTRAVHEDALEIVRTAWRREQTKRAGDPASALATVMDMPLRVAQRYFRQDEPADAPPSVPAPPKRRPRRSRR